MKTRSAVVHVWCSPWLRLRKAYRREILEGGSYPLLLWGRDERSRMGMPYAAATGELAEWPNALALKTRVADTDPGFESLTLR